MKITYFSSPSCQPCRIIGPMVQRFAQQQRAELIKIDVSTPEGSATAARIGISSIPAIVLEVGADQPLMFVGPNQVTRAMEAYNAQ